MKKFLHTIAVVSPLIVIVAFLLAMTACGVAVSLRNPDVAAAALGFAGLGLVAYGVTVTPELIGVASESVVASAAPRFSVESDRTGGIENNNVVHFSRNDNDTIRLSRDRVEWAA